MSKRERKKDRRQAGQAEAPSGVRRSGPRGWDGRVKGNAPPGSVWRCRRCGGISWRAELPVGLVARAIEGHLCRPCAVAAILGGSAFDGGGGAGLTLATRRLLVVAETVR